MSVTLDKETFEKQLASQPQSSGLSLKTTIITMIIMMVAATIIGGGVALWANSERNAAVDRATNSLASISADIRELVQKNDIPGDSQIIGTVQDAPTEGQIINSETNKSYLFSLPPFSRTGILYTKPYISVSGTVDDYTITFSNEGKDLVAVYDSATDSITYSEYQG